MKYVLYFSKNGFCKYTSHLDMQRLFKRAFRRAGIELSYSHGFNPHPLMSFAQPLSLGYAADREMLEFSTDRDYDPVEIRSRLEGNLAHGMGVSRVDRYENKKSPASQVVRAEYEVLIPVPYYEFDYDQIIADYLEQNQILAMKRQKKTKQLKEVNIRGKIGWMKASPTEGGIGVDILKANLLKLHMMLDCGSQSNVSPELVISTFIKFANLEVTRDRVEVRRLCMHFPEGTELEEKFGGTN